MEQYIPGAFTIFVLVVLVGALIILWNAVKTVPQAEEWTVERFGRYIRTLDPGLHLLTPFVDRVGFKISMRETVLDVPPQDVITYDNATVRCDAVVFYQVIMARQAAYEVSDLERAMGNLSMTNIRSVIGSMALDDVLSNRDSINDRLLLVIDQATNPWGIKVNRIEIKDLTPPADLVVAMGGQMKAEREKRAEILQAEGEKQSAILRSEGEKQAAILQAEGRREAAFRDAEAREREAEAEGRATTMISEAIANGTVQAVNFAVAQRYTQALEKIASAPNQKLILMPLEASSVIGALAGVAELTKEALTDGRKRDGSAE